MHQVSCGERLNVITKMKTFSHTSKILNQISYTCNSVCPLFQVLRLSYTDLTNYNLFPTSNTSLHVISFIFQPTTLKSGQAGFVNFHRFGIHELVIIKNHFSNLSRYYGEISTSFQGQPVFPCMKYLHLIWNLPYVSILSR